jgi:hypothetical protein
MSYFFWPILIFLYASCSQTEQTGQVRIRPSKFSATDSIFIRPSFKAVLARFQELNENYFQKKYHQFHHQNSNDKNRFEGSYGLGNWDNYSKNIQLPGNREEMNATPYPSAAVAADIALAYLYVYSITRNKEYADAAAVILNNFLKREQLKSVVPIDQLFGEELSIVGSFPNWTIRTVFPYRYLFPLKYEYLENSNPLENNFEHLRKLSVPPFETSHYREILNDSIGYHSQFNMGTVLTYSGRTVPDYIQYVNRPDPIVTTKAVRAYAEAIQLEFPEAENYLRIISTAAQGLYGFDLKNRWDTPATEVGARVVGLTAVIRVLTNKGITRLPIPPEWPVNELFRDALTRIRNVADPNFPGWFQDWSPGGPIPVRYDWWMIQSGPDFFGTDIIDQKRYPWFLLIHDNYDNNDDNQLWYFSQILLGIADFYPLIESIPETKVVRQHLQDFLCQGFNYFYHFQDTTNNKNFKGGIEPDAYSVREFSINLKDYAQYDNGYEERIKRFSHRSFGKDALTYPFPIGLQAAITTAMNIPPLKKQLRPLIYSGMNHLLACDILYQPTIDNPELAAMRNWLAPEIFKTLGLYLIYFKKNE